MKTVKITNTSYLEMETLRLMLLRRDIALDKKSTVEYAIRAMLKKITAETKKNEPNA
jgi:hypothetical protein